MYIPCHHLRRLIMNPLFCFLTWALTIFNFLLFKAHYPRAELQNEALSDHNQIYVLIPFRTHK